MAHHTIHIHKYPEATPRAVGSWPSGPTNESRESPYSDLHPALAKCTPRMYTYEGERRYEPTDFTVVSRPHWAGGGFFAFFYED